MSEGNSTYQILLTASDKTREAFESAKSNSQSLTDKLDIMRGAFAATAIASATAVAVMIKGSIDAADAMSKAAQKVGTTTEMLSGLKYAADMSDVSFELLQKSLGKLSSNAYSAATSGGEAAAAFKTLGINVKGTDGHLKDSGTMLEELAGKFAAMPDGAEKSALAIKLFGKAGMDMIPLLNSGSEGLAQMRGELDKMGGTISTETALRAEEFNDKLGKMAEITKSFGAVVASDLLPAINELTDAYMKATESGNNFSGASAVIKTIFETFAVVGVNTAYVFHSVGNEIGGIAAQLTALATGDFEGVARIGKMMKEDAEAARKEVDALSERILNPPKREASADKSPSAIPSLDTEEVNKSLDALLKKSQQFSAELVISHESAFDKIVTKYVAMDAELTKAGAAGTEQRKELSIAFETFMIDEQTKRTIQIAEAAAKETEGNNKIIEAQQEKFAKMKEQADQASTFGEERENMRYESQLRELERDRKVLEDKHLWDLKSEDKYQAAMAALKKQHQAKQMQSDIAMVNFGRAVKAGEYTDAMSMAAKMTAGIAGHSRAAFEINKVASIASAIMNTYKGVAGVLGEFPGPAGWAMAAAQAAIGFVQVDMINSTQFGGGAPNMGGGGVPSMATAPGIPVSPQQDIPQAPIPVAGVEAQAPRTVNLIMSSSDSAEFFSAKTIRDLLIPALNEAAGDGVTINVVTG